MTTEKAPTVDADCMIKSPHTSKLVDLEKKLLSTSLRLNICVCRWEH